MIKILFITHFVVKERFSLFKRNNNGSRVNCKFKYSNNEYRYNDKKYWSLLIL